MKRFTPTSNRRRTVSRLFVRPIILGMAFFAFAGSAEASYLLYDGSLGTAPSAQGWLYLTEPILSPSATRGMQGSTTILNTTAVMSDKAGYFDVLHPMQPVLDRSQGYRIRFDLQVTSESHASVHRAGFSVIAIGHDQMGLELGFWEDEVWAQDDSPLFTHAEGAAFDTTAALTTYELLVLGSGYTLHANGTPILQGALRDYSSFGFPYDDPNLLFFGDDTSSAAARVRLGRFEVSAVPELSSAWLAASGVIGLSIARRFRRRCRVSREA